MGLGMDSGARGPSQRGPGEAAPSVAEVVRTHLAKVGLPDDGGSVRVRVGWVESVAADTCDIVTLEVTAGGQVSTMWSVQTETIAAAGMSLSGDVFALIEATGEPAAPKMLIKLPLSDEAVFSPNNFGEYHPIANVWETIFNEAQLAFRTR